MVMGPHGGLVGWAVQALPQPVMSENTWGLLSPAGGCGPPGRVDVSASRTELAGKFEPLQSLGRAAQVSLTSDTKCEFQGWHPPPPSGLAVPWDSELTKSRYRHDSGWKLAEGGSTEGGIQEGPAAPVPSPWNPGVTIRTEYRRPGKLSSPSVSGGFTAALLWGLVELAGWLLGCALGPF